MDAPGGAEFESGRLTSAALARVSELAAEYEGREGTLEFYGTATAEALSERRAAERDVDYRALLADVSPVATVELSKVHRRHVDAVETVLGVHASHERVISVVVPDE